MGHITCSMQGIYMQVKNFKITGLFIDNTQVIWQSNVTVKRQFARNGIAFRIEKGYWIKFFSKCSKSCNIWHLQD
jgi:hypothetical protein